jgi:hypothetical protein
LVGHQVEQGAGAQQQHAPPDGAALELERHLRAAQRVDAGQGPARQRQHAVGGAAGDDELAPGQALAALGMQHVEPARAGVPHQVLGAVVE